MKQVLTAQIAHKYAGCGIYVMESQYTDVEAGKYKVYAICNYGIEIIKDADDNLRYFTVAPRVNFSDCQLILWRLEDIREEDAIEVAKIYCFKNPAEQNDDSIDMCYISGDELHIAPNGFPTVVEFISELPYQAADFLRASEHNGKPKPAYDLDGLIDSGCAVDGKLLTV